MNTLSHLDKLVWEVPPGWREAQEKKKLRELRVSKLIKICLNQKVK